jgi:ELWxxDGT repeat protein
VVTNGTAAGTHELTGISGAASGPHIRGLTQQPPTFSPEDFAVLNGEVLFEGTDASGPPGQKFNTGTPTLWMTDGTAAGTHELTGISGANSGGLNPSDLTIFNGEVLFNGTDSVGHLNLWVTNGTAAGTYELGPIHATNLDPNGFTVFNHEVLFDGMDLSGNAGLWVTNGTAVGTYELTGIAGVYSGGLFAGITSPGFSVFNNEVLFDGRDASGSFGLWATNGTAVGTYEVR